MRQYGVEDEAQLLCGTLITFGKRYKIRCKDGNETKTRIAHAVADIKHEIWGRVHAWTRVLVGSFRSQRDDSKGTKGTGGPCACVRPAVAAG